MQLTDLYVTVRFCPYAVENHEKDDQEIVPLHYLNKISVQILLLISYRKYHISFV